MLTLITFVIIIAACAASGAAIHYQFTSLN